MCGIAGCYQQADGQKLTDIMVDRIAHRGPDATGTWSHEDGRVAVQFGHRRLSIIDLSAAADQPLSKHGMTLVYNGELYNYRALGAELRIEPGALVASMLYYWVPEQRCAIDGVRKLPGGSWARFRPDGSSAVEHYWRPADVAAEAAAGPPADLGPVIEESVTAHLV